MPRDGFYFRSKWSISQQGVDFAVEGHFRSPFRSCEMRLEGCEITLVCQGVVSQLREFLQKLRNHFLAKGLFRSQALISQRASWGYEIILQPMAIFVGASFGLRNLADHEFSQSPELILTPRDLPLISLQFLLN